MSVTFACPFCDTQYTANLKEKDTFACQVCHRPYDVQPDGSVAISALFWAAGRVEYTEAGFLYDPGLPSFRTAEQDGIKGGGREPSQENIEALMALDPSLGFYAAREELREQAYGGKPPYGGSWGQYWKMY